MNSYSMEEKEPVSERCINKQSVETIEEKELILTTISTLSNCFTALYNTDCRRESGIILKKILEQVDKIE